MMVGKLDWDETVARLYRDIPSAKGVDWEALFRADPKILGDLINDVIKVAISKKGRPGKRSANSEADVAADLRKLTGSDYADTSFPRAMKIAMGDRSLRQTASLANMDKMTLHRLLGGGPVTPKQMEDLALALKKEPSYFVEYRAAYVCKAVYEMLCLDPDSSIIFYKKIKNRSL